MTSTTGARRAAPRRRGPASSRRARGVARGAEVGIARGLTVVVSALCTVGLLMVYSSSTVDSIGDGRGSPFSIITKQVVFLTVGALCYLGLARFDYRKLRRFAPVGLAGGIVLLVLVFTPIGIKEFDAHRWVGFGDLRFQPSEMVKLPLALFLAAFLATREREGTLTDFRRTAVPIGLIVAVISGLILCQPDFDGLLVMLALVAGVLLVAAVPWRWLAGGAVAAGVAALIAFTVPMFHGPMRRARLLVFLHPWESADDKAYQILQSLSSVALGGWTGVGLGNGTAKWFVPVVYSDFVFAVIAEELGFLGCAVVIGCYLLFGVLGFRAAMCAPDRFGTLLAVGLTLTVLVQATINIGMVVGILPVSGLTLPFVSYGGTSLVSMLAAAGVLQNIARQAKPRAAR